MTDIRSLGDNARQKAVSFFNYLAELARLRAKTIHDLDAYEDVFWFDSIPSDRNCHCLAWGKQEDEADDIWLYVKKREEPPCPKPPEECRIWVDERTLFDSAGEPRLRERIPIESTPASEEQRLVEEFSKPIEYRLLSDNPRVQDEFADYVLHRWKSWAASHREWKELQSCYAELFKIYQSLQRLGEQFELVLGLGFLTWKLPTEEKIRRHVLVADATLEFDASSGAFFVRSGAEGSKLRLETDMLSPNVRPPVAVQHEIENSILEIAESPWDRSTLFPVLMGWVQSLQEKGEFTEVLSAQDEVMPNPKISFSPALLLRRRTCQSMLTALDQILKQLQQPDGEIPPEILRIISDPDEFGRTVDGPTQYESRPTDLIPESFLFPLPANSEQTRIVHAIARRRGVLVQGPPGTGKSHTIANLICHLLATGKKVLITAQTPRALRVLQDKLPSEIAPLCVSLLGNDVGAQRNLERCISEISNKYAQWNAARNCSASEELSRLLNKLYSRQSELEKSLRVLREAETHVHEIIGGAYRGTAQKIAERVLVEAHDYGWLRDAICAESPPPFEAAEFISLRNSLLTIDASRLSELKQNFPNPSLLPTPDNFVKLIREENAAAEYSSKTPRQHDEIEFRAIRNATKDSVKRLFTALQGLLVSIQNVQRRPISWIRDAVFGILTDHDSPWKTLRERTSTLLEGLRERIIRLESISFQIPPDQTTDELLAHANDLIAHLDQGRGLGWWVFRPTVVKRTLHALEMARVNGRKCALLPDLKLLVDDLETGRALVQLWDLWASKIIHTDAARIIQVSEFEEQLEALDLVIGIEGPLEAAKVACKEVPGLGEPGWHDVSQISRLVSICESVMAESRLSDVRQRFELLLDGLRAIAAKGNAHPVVRELQAAIEGRDAEEYGRQLMRVSSAQADIEQVNQRRALLNQLKSAAPQFEKELRESPSDDSWDERLPKVCEAWKWARARHWLAEYLRPGREEGLESQVKETQLETASATACLAANRAWGYFFERLTEGQRQHLSAWQQAIKRLGKGTGRHAVKHRRDAQEHLDKCREAIPAWIMPVFRVLETVKPSPEAFDVLIVDEASQCGPESLILLYLAKKVIIVGDDQQISPEAVGINQDDVEYLMRQHLSEIDHRDSFGVTSSLFGHGVIRYGNRIVLREHFRCMPEIIRFSNDLCYADTPLVPLRQSPPRRLKPIVAHHVHGGFREGTATQVINRREAEALVRAVVACCRDPQYADKSMGVISLQGASQAHLIETMLMEELDIREIEKRRIVCGDAYSFQGDERDVIFLSLVAAPNHRIGALTREPDKRRFNVAASRARDQMWLFHSVALSDLSASCFRRELLKYCLNPLSRRVTVEGLDIDTVERQAIASNRVRVSPPKPFDSWFEVDVFLRIVAKGFRVIPQFEVAGYRIDLVVEGTSARLAVEVDGDEWHGPEHYEADLERQRILERCGWKFWRVRGSEFYANPDKSLEGLWHEIESRSIEVASDQFGTHEIDGYVPNIDWGASMTVPDSAASVAVPIVIGTHDQSGVQSTGDRQSSETRTASSSIVASPVETAGLDISDGVMDQGAVAPESLPSIGNSSGGLGSNGNELALQAMSIESQVWYRLAKWAKDLDLLQGKDRRMLFSMGRITERGSPMSEKQAKYAMDLYRKCADAGFVG